MVTKDDILEAAFRLFARQGFHKASMESIARELGIKKQSLYSHFISKDEIIQTVLKTQADRIRQELDRLILEHQNESVERLLKYFFIRITLFLSERERLLLCKRITLYFCDSPLQVSISQAIGEYHKSISGGLCELLTEKCAPFRNPDSLKIFLDSYAVLIHGFLDIVLASGYSIETAERVWDIFWGGAKALCEGPDGNR